MKVVALICLLLLSPVLAMENSFPQPHYDRIEAGKKQVTELQEESLKTLLRRKDSVTLVKNRIDKKRQRLRAPGTFLEELDNLLKLLPHPEDLLTIEQRRLLIGFPILEHLQPILNVIENLGNFVEKWQSLTAYAEVLQLATNQTIWYEREWTMLAQEMGSKLTQKTLCCGDLLKIYRYISYFHAEGAHLTTAYKDLKFILQKMAAFLPKDLVYLDSLLDELVSFFHIRGSTLWGIIRYSNLIITTDGVQNLAGNYDDLPNDFFLDNANLIKKILSETDPSYKVTTITLGSSRQDPSSLKSRSIHSLPMSPQLPSLSRVQKVSSSSIRHSRSDSNLPTFPRAKEKMPEISFEEKIQKVFTQPNQWSEYVIDVKEKILLLIHANFIADPLRQLLNFYDNFRLSYLRNHTEAFDILSPKAFLDIPGHPLIKIPQTRARKVCGLKSNGHLCFNLPECDEETVPTFNNCIDDLVFKKRRELYPASTREQILQFWFEKLFGLPSDPILIGACGDVSFYTPKGNQKPNLNFYSEIYVTNPEAWEIQQNLDFVTIHRKHKGGLLSTLLNQIAAGESSFKEQLDEIAIGVRILFGLSTKECASPENFGLVKNKRKFDVKRVNSNSFLQPLFMVREDKNHHFIGHNIFYFLPYIDEKIPEGVKKIFIDEIFPSLFLSLGAALTHLTEIQKNFNEFILKYKLTEDDSLKDMLGLEVGLSKADVLGLTLTTRKETIQEFIQNCMFIEKQLSSSEITYRQIWRALRPVELDCYEQVFENARKKTQTTPIFFTKVIFSLIERLRRAHENMVGETPPYTMEELDLFEKAAILYRQKIMAHLKEIDTLNDRKMSASSQKENIEIIQANNEREISILREKLLSLDNVERKDVEQVETHKLCKSPALDNIAIPIKKAGLNSVSSIETSQHEEALEHLEKAIKKQEESKLKLNSLLEELERIDQSLKELYRQLSPDVLLNEPLDQISQNAHIFLKEKYKWAEKNHIFHANIVLKAWESLFDAEKPVIYEKFIKSASSPDWAQVPVLTQNQLTTVYAQLVESDHPIESMVQDLIDHADISSLSPSAALELLDRLLALKPQPETYHKSWMQMVEIASKEFLGITPRVRSFLRTLGLREEVELRILEAAQLRRYEICGQQIRNAASNLKKFSTPEQFAYAFFHQLWQGYLELSPDNQLFLDGLIKLFSLPLHGAQTSAGFAINPESKGGIFDLRYKVGDHYLLIDTTDWIKLFQSSHILPTQIRLDILSNPLWCIQYLDSLKQLYPNILSHPWYPKTIINKMKLLHDLLQTGLSFTFNDIISAVWPEFHFAIQQKLKSHNNDIDLTLKAEHTRGINQLTPIEHKGINLDYPEQGKNMFSLLKEWDEEHLQCISASSLSLDDAATEWLAHIIPENYGPEILARMLDLATRFTIDPSKIKPSLWANPKILTELARINAPIHCLQLATALRAGLSFKEAFLIKKPTYYQISGLKGNIPLISELICLFPEVTSLNLSNNQLRSLKPLVSSLKSLPHLTNLNVSNNPIHNPAPLAEFPALTDLNIEYTGIPDVSPQGLKELIAREKRIKAETVKLLGTMHSFQSGPSKKQQSELGEGESEINLIKRIRTYMKHPDRLSFQDIDAMISILEQLGEVWWLHTLVLNEEMISLPCDELFNLCRDFDPRVVLDRLLFAIKYRLPHGTNRDTLSFVNETPSMQTDCLRRLDVSNVCINQKFLQSLSQFENLFELRLNKVQLTNLNDLPKLPQLKILHLGNNNITTLLGLHTEAQETKFPELNVLILAQNKIVSDMGIRFLLELGKLTFLDLSNNCLTQMPSLGNLFLQRIFLNHNKIPLRELTNYQEDENHRYKPQNQ